MWHSGYLDFSFTETFHSQRDGGLWGSRCPHSRCILSLKYLQRHPELFPLGKAEPDSLDGMVTR